jgi:hypothetical protein
VENRLKTVGAVVLIGDTWDHAPSRRPRLEVLGGPGMYWNIQIPLTYDWGPAERKLLIEPGELHCQVRYYGVKPDENGLLVIDRNRYLESNLVSLEIPPVQEDDAEALNAVNQLRFPEVLCKPVPMRSSGPDFDALQRIIENHGGSVYATYARYAAAHALIWQDSEHLEQPGSANLKRGIDYLRDVLRDPRFVLDEHARELLWQAEIQQTGRNRWPVAREREFLAFPVHRRGYAIEP